MPRDKYLYAAQLLLQGATAEDLVNEYKGYTDLSPQEAKYIGRLESALEDGDFDELERLMKNRSRYLQNGKEAA